MLNSNLFNMNNKYILSSVAFLFTVYFFFTNCTNNIKKDNSNDSKEELAEKKAKLLEPVELQWTKVQSAYQRRANLIPNLAEVVKDFVPNEKKAIEGIISAHDKVSSITIDLSNLTPEKLQEFQAAQGELSQALGRLFVVLEQYPEVKANENYKALLTKLEGTENRINEERNKFNDAAQTYNVKIRKFPNGFNKMPKFEAPDVKF